MVNQYVEMMLEQDVIKPDHTVIKLEQAVIRSEHTVIKVERSAKTHKC